VVALKKMGRIAYGHYVLNVLLNCGMFVHARQALVSLAWYLLALYASARISPIFTYGP
jgi:hypothetical protein